MRRLGAGIAGAAGLARPSRLGFLVVPAAESRLCPKREADFLLRAWTAGTGLAGMGVRPWGGMGRSDFGSVRPSESVGDLAQGGCDASTVLIPSGDAVCVGRVRGLGGRRTPGGGS